MGRPRKYTLDENYFENIISDNATYALGFIYADGSIYHNYLSVKLSAKDIEILNFLKSELNYNGIISKYVVKNREYVGLTVSSKKIISDLINLGVVYNKTYLSKTLPIYPKEYENSFLRGFFDGDGSISLNNCRGKAEYTITYSSNKTVLNEIKQILLKNNISCCNIRHRHNSDESCMLEIRGNRNIEKLYKLLYDNAEFYLKRKKERFDNFMLMLEGLKKRNILDETISDISELYCFGLKQTEIARIKGMPSSSVRTVVQRLRKHGKIE